MTKELKSLIAYNEKNVINLESQSEEAEDGETTDRREETKCADISTIGHNMSYHDTIAARLNQSIAGHKKQKDVTDQIALQFGGSVLSPKQS